MPLGRSGFMGTITVLVEESLRGASTEPPRQDPNEAPPPGGVSVLPQASQEMQPEEARAPISWGRQVRFTPANSS
jgi:hypothetical protein